MKIKVFLIIITLAAVSGVDAQESSVKTAFQLKKTEISFKPETKLTGKKTDPEKSEESLSEAAKQNNLYVRPDSKKRFKRYVNKMIGFQALALSAVNAGISTATNEPEEWQGNWEGFGRRFASNMGRRAIRETAVYSLDEALKLDSAFYRSDKRDVGSRVKNALFSPVTARKPNGERTVGVPRLVGTFASHIIARETWYPKRFGYKDGLKSGTISLGMNAAFNLFKEFIWKK